MHEALVYEKLDGTDVRCHLCGHNCLISEGHRGICGVRENRGGTLYSLVYGKVIALNVDPIEKKPLYHFLPGSTSLSLATAGCNFRCKHCQNYEISQYARERATFSGREMQPADLVGSAVSNGCRSISYTYTEPTIFFEYALDCARIAAEKGIRNVFVSNGYTGSEATRIIAPCLNANNIDLKGSDRFYREICGARLKPVLETIILMKELGVWVEVTTLVIPGLNDSAEDLREIAGFISSVDPAIPWHVSQFHPTYLLLDRPRTPVETLLRAREIGLSLGLKYVYLGNVPGEGGEDTGCPACGETVIRRSGYRIVENRLAAGCCPVCSAAVHGVWA